MLARRRGCPAREGEHGGMVGACDDYSARPDLCGDVPWSSEAIAWSSPLRKASEQRKGRPPVLVTVFGDDHWNETGMELPNDGLQGRYCQLLGVFGHGE
jgi:hypothetical protein